MPGTALRAPSERRKVFHAAIIGRGSDVESTVSSMSDTIPCVTSLPITSTGTSMVCAFGDPTKMRCHPGVRPWPRTVRSMNPPRSVRAVVIRSLMRIVTTSSIAGVVKNARHPRVSSSTARSRAACVGSSGSSCSPRVMITRANTRSCDSLPYPVSGTIRVLHPRDRSRPDLRSL
jgi:hypothetical protein